MDLDRPASRCEQTLLIRHEIAHLAKSVPAIVCPFRREVTALNRSADVFYTAGHSPVRPRAPTIAKQPQSEHQRTRSEGSRPFDIPVVTMLADDERISSAPDHVRHDPV